MKRTFILLMVSVMFLTLLCSCQNVRDSAQQSMINPSSLAETKPNDPEGEGIELVYIEPSANGSGENDAMTAITITVGGSAFSAKFYDNAAANALLEQFPMTLNMSELNGNEKYYYLADNLPSEGAESPATMNAGDIMCWSGNCLVLFYKTFPNSYGGYVRLGYVEDASGLADALGNGNVQITFAVEN